MNAATVQLILGLLPVATKLILEVGGKLVEINTSELNDPAEISEAFAAAQAEGFPQLKFVSSAEG
ncbi:MAG: hypothetical protein VB050_03320 [Geobacteraceae bacterium]|nr:hypothetical protein [Geobacteraceae bacterium]